jgi:tRNA threonylcarbamoyl adenosine modification protein YjeE
LGAGKTELARAIVQERVGEAIEVPSPTFTLVQTYETPGLTIAHADLYRVENIGELAELGLDEAIDGGAILVEWPERAQGLWPDSRLEIILHIDGSGPARILELVARGDWAARVARLVANWA